MLQIAGGILLSILILFVIRIVIITIDHFNDKGDHIHYTD